MLLPPRLILSFRWATTDERKGEILELSFWAGLMLRYGLVAYLLAMQLAGPSLCFCAMTRLATHALRKNLPQASDKINNLCCSEQRTANRAACALPESRSDANRPMPKCPCQEHVAKNVSFFVS